MATATSEAAYVRDVFGLSQRDLARAMSVAPYTVQRWEAGQQPKGLQADVLSAFHQAAEQIAECDDEARKAVVRSMIMLGVGTFLAYHLTRV